MWESLDDFFEMLCITIGVKLVKNALFSAIRWVTLQIKSWNSETFHIFCENFSANSEKSQRCTLALEGIRYCNPGNFSKLINLVN